MNDSSERNALDEKRTRNRQQRLQAIKRWVEYVDTHEPEVWGEQQNRLVNSQLESARESDVDVERRQRVERAGREHSD